MSSLNQLITLVMIIFAFGLCVFVGRVAVEAVQTALSLDQQLAESTAPQLNHHNLEKALEIINNKSYQPGSTPLTLD